jgi:hypothetical protein
MPTLELGAGPQTATTGSPYSHPVRAIATNGLGGQQVTVTSVTATWNGATVPLPANSFFAPALPIVGQPALATFNWNPSLAQAGTWGFTYHLVDQLGAAGVGTVELIVSDPVGGVVECFVFASQAPGFIDLGGGDAILIDLTNWSWFSFDYGELMEFSVPNNPALIGLNFYIQVGLYDADIYPADSIKTSNGMHVTIGSSAIQSYGTSSGITLWSTTPPFLDTDFRVEFVIL